MESMSGFRAPAMVAASVRRAQIKARVSDGEKPANHTNATSAIMRNTNVSFFTPARLPKKTAIAENIERCMPESAKI